MAQNSPSASSLLNLGALEVEHYGAGQSVTGSEYGFSGTPQSLNLDAIMQGDLATDPLAGYVSLATELGGPSEFASTFKASDTSPLHPPYRNSVGDHRGNSPGASASTGADHGQTNGNDQAQPDDPSMEAQDITPAWSELKTKAGKERKRLPLACIACRRKKIRCSGEKPACRHCLRSRIPCVYKVTTRKAAPRTDYMAMLDKRLKRMEERVIKIIPKDDQSDALATTGRANVKPPLPPAPPRPTVKKRGPGQAFAEELEDWASAKPTAAAGKAGSEHVADDTTKDSDEYNLLMEGADKLPTKEIQEHLIEVFFDYVYCQSYPLLHKPSFVRKYANGAIPPVLMLSVCGISARFSNHPALKSDPAFLRGEEWASAARDIALRRYDAPNITVLICYLILGLHEFGTCQGGRSWMLAGMAQRMAYALQLHRDLDYDPKSRNQDGKQEDMTATDREIRRRTMWACFLMDGFTSSGTERPIFLADQYIRAQLPIKESHFQKEITGPTEDLEGQVPNPVEPAQGQVSDAKSNMGVGAYIIRLVAIWGKIIHYLNLGGRERDAHPMWSEQSAFSATKRATQKWKDDLPESLHYTPENLQTHASEGIANQFLFMHIVYSQIVLFTNRFALPAPGVRPSFPKDMPVEFIQNAAKIALEAANQISALVNEAMDHRVVAPFAGYCAFYSSTVHIHGAFSSNAALETSSKQNLAWNVKYLTKMKKYWGMFHFVTENLRDLYRKHADAARQGKETINPDGKGPGNGIFQYGDWFDRYPHGVSGTDYEEPSAKVKKEPGADGVLGQTSDLQTVEEFFSKLAPPSRAVQQAAPPAPRKKKRSKSESKQNNLSKAQQARNPTEDNDAAAGMDTTSAVDLTSPTMPSGMEGFTGFPITGTAMSQIDRQMVMDSYAGLDNSSAMSQNAFLQNNLMTGAPNNFTEFDQASLSGYNNNDNNGTSSGGESGFWGDPSTAWFMPFNMNPPSVGEDSNTNNMFTGSNGSIDWMNYHSLAPGFGPTGLTPRPIDMDLDTNDEQQNNS